MSSVVKPTDRHVDGILKYMRDYLTAREQQVVRMNPRSENVISDITWIHLEILRKVLRKGKSFGGEKYPVADVLIGADDNRRRALFSASDQNSIMDEIVERDDAGVKNADQSIHDMRTFFRSIDPSLENLVQLIQHWVKWDLPDAADQCAFDEQMRRLKALCGVQFTDDIRTRYRQALGRPVDAPVTDEEIFQVEMRRLDQIAGRFCARRSEDEPYQLILRRETIEGSDQEGEPFDYKLRQCDAIAAKLQEEKNEVASRLGTPANGGTSDIHLSETGSNPAIAAQA